VDMEYAGYHRRAVSRYAAFASMVPMLLLAAAPVARANPPNPASEAQVRKKTTNKASDETREQPKSKRSKPAWADFSYRYDPRDLYEEFLRNNTWRRIWGPIGIGEFHIFPARQTGENFGPPLRIWGHGFGTSLWRDPITGHPLM